MSMPLFGRNVCLPNIYAMIKINEENVVNLEKGEKGSNGIGKDGNDVNTVS